MHLKTMVRYYYPATKMAKIKSLTIPHVDEYVEHLELSYIIGGIVNEHWFKISAVSYLTTNKKACLITQQFHPEIYTQEKMKR